jgi:NLI interacting factor-like phosphatase
LRKGSHELKTGSVEEGSSAGAMHHAADKLLEAANMPADTMPKTTLAGPSPKKQKKQRPPSPPKVDAPALDVEEASTQVSSDDRVEPRKSPVRVEMSKLLVFNVHGTLLDCSLLQDPDPNTSIRYTMKTPTRRVVCRPWMAEFLSRCFDHFEVAFWGNKSAAYMEDLVPAMLRRMNEDRNLVPLFVWSQRECEPIQLEGGAPTVWGKPLQRIFDQWPQWNHSNTLIIDHRRDRVASNRGSNVLLTRPFYVADMEKLGDDMLHLKASVWPLLEKFSQTEDVAKFRKHFRRVLEDAGICRTKLTETKAVRDVAGDVQGEGTYEPIGSYGSLSPCLAFKLISNSGTCCL